MTAVFAGDTVADVARTVAQEVGEPVTQVEDAHIVALIVDENVFGGWHPAVRQADAKRLITQPSHICGEPFTIHAGRWVLESRLFRREFREQVKRAFLVRQPCLNQPHWSYSSC